MNIFEALKKFGYTTCLNDTWEMMEDQDAWVAKICKQYPAIADMISQSEKDYDSRKAAASNLHEQVLSGAKITRANWESLVEFGFAHKASTFSAGAGDAESTAYALNKIAASTYGDQVGIDG
jgi:enolase